VFRQILGKMKPELRSRIQKMESEGLYGHGREFEKNRYTDDYMICRVGEGYFPYLYQNHPDPNYSPTSAGNMSWDLYKGDVGVEREYVIDGNLASVEYAGKLGTIRVPTLITAGDNDECSPALAREMNALIPGSQLVVLPRSGHMTFVDQPAMFIKAVNDFLQ